MALLYIKNTSTLVLPVTGSIGKLNPHEAKVLSLAAAEIEAAGPALSRMSAAGLITYTVSDDTGADDQTEYATLAEVSDAVAGGVGSSDAHAIWSRAINNSVAPTDGQVLQYSTTSSNWFYATLSNPYTYRIIVGNAPAGDTTRDCHYLDSGNGAGIEAALAAAAALSPLRVVVFVRRGNYVLDMGVILSPLVVPTGCELRGEGRYATIITTFAGSATRHMTSIILTAGTLNSRTAIREMGIRVPSNTVGVAGAGPRGVVNYNAYCIMENIDSNVAVATTTNCASLFFQADYATSYPHGCVFRHITHDGSALNTPTGANCATVIRSLCDGVAPTNGAPLPILDHVYYRGPSGLSSLIGQVILFRPVSADIRHVRSTFAQYALLTAATYSYTGSVRGPRIHDVVNDIRGFVGTAPVTAYATLVNHGCSNVGGLTVYGASITDAVLLYDTSNIDTAASDVLLVDGNTTHVDATIAGCQTLGTVAGGLPMRIRASNTSGSNGTIDGLTLLNCGGKNTDLILRTDSASNVIRNVRVVAPHCRHFTTQVTAGTLDNIAISAPTITGTTTIGAGTTRVSVNGVGMSYASSANSFTIPDVTSFVEAGAASGAIAATLSTPTLTPNTWLPMKVMLTSSNADGLTVTAPGGYTIMGAASFLLPGSNAAPPTTADRSWTLRLVGTDFRVT